MAGMGVISLSYVMLRPLATVAGAPGVVLVLILLGPLRALRGGSLTEASPSSGSVNSTRL